ncbi:serine kinase [bacterium]|nr:serine kinase [bacterium]
MNVFELVEKLNFEIKAGKENLNNEITGGYASDLLSDVLANSGEGNLWITLQIHQNIVAIAELRNLAGIVIINNRQPDEDTIEKADRLGIPLLVSGLPAFELIGRLYSMGISGKVKDVQGD